MIPPPTCNGLWRRYVHSCPGSRYIFAARSKPWDQRAATVEAALQEDLQRTLGTDYDPRHFIPYIQLYEFEALVFADVHKLADAVAPLN